ncbi:MAG TPA: FtsX-like permease family protein [Lachnospiraceae bacterium]|nr:FtsX-like permease family protein [Lachnospiraceae bacterium]
MLKVMLQKLWHKKWMVMCLLLGSILLIATVVSFPMYRNAAFDRMLQDEFQEYLAEKGEWPGRNEFIMVSKKDAGGKAMNKMETLMQSIYQDLGVTEKQTTYLYGLGKAEAHSLMNREDVNAISLKIGFLSDLENHAKLLSGEMYSSKGLTDDGCYEAVISQACMVSANLLVGETLEMDALKDGDGNPIRIKIVGVFAEDSNSDFYWQTSADEMDGFCLISEELFRSKFTKENAGKFTITCKYSTLFEYEDIKAIDVKHLKEQTTYLTEESPFRSTLSKPDYAGILEQFESKKGRIEATLFILQIPVLVLLCAFLLMISGQMYDMERNEISVIKSRGSSGGQIFRLYLYQSIFLTLFGALAGLPLGSLFCRLLGAARNFLEFSIRGELHISYTRDVLLYLLVSIVASILIMTLPAIKHSKLSIVKLKQQKALKKRSWWEKCFLDVICLGVSLYGFYSFRGNEEALEINVLRGEALDPLLYISSSLFIVGMGLLFLRLRPLLVRFIYFLGKRYWQPASYASFTENIKNGRKQQSIMLFMILTISLGMFHAIVARTILQNATDNSEYICGTDLMVKEIWTNNGGLSADGSPTELQYSEPDYVKYARLDCVSAYTRVMYDEKAYIPSTGNKRQNIILMGIHTKEFGEITNVSRDLLEKPYNTYLNELAAVPNGVLVSRNFEGQLGYKVGDIITYNNNDKFSATGKIVDFVDYWPGYISNEKQLLPDGSVENKDNFLVVANYGPLKQSWGAVPYEVWMTLKEGASTDNFYDWVSAENIKVTKYVDKGATLTGVVEDPLLQGTNGVLTMGFIVTMILCIMGYLIYWIMSIRSREMLFGVLRACGMHKGEVFHMLINEQIFSGVLSILAGLGIGKLTSELFVPMLQTAYAAANQVLPMQLITNTQDMVRLYGVVILGMLVCLLVLILLVFKLNVTKALKLGEE